MKKTIKSTRSNLIYDIERADWSVKFRTPENYYRHAERRVWVSAVGFNMFVEYKGAFYMVGRTDEHGYITSIDFTEVSAEEAAAAKYESARELAGEAQSAEIATSAAALDYDREAVEEQAREAHFAAMAAKNSAEAARRYAEQAGTKEAFVFVEMALEEAERARQFAADAADIAESYTEPEQATERKSAEPETAAQISEATKEASRAASDAEKAAREVVEARDICDADAADNRAQSAARYATEAANRYDADEVTRAEADNAARAAQLAREALTARVISGITEADAEAANSSDYAERLAREAVQKAGGNMAELEAAQRALIIAELISDEDTRAHLEVFAAAHQWSPQETRENVTHAAQISAANAAAVSLLNAYAEAIGEYPDENDPETVAAYRVARDELTGGDHRATREDRETVDAMVEAIASQIYGIVILDADGAETEVMSYQTKAERDETERHLNLSEYDYMGAMGEYDYYREPDRAAEADAAADALTREYRAIVNDHPTTTPDPCTREAEAARRVARHDIARELGSTREDREIVSYMVEAIALQAAEEAETEAAYAAFEANRREHIGEYLVKYEWSGEGLYRIAWSDGGQKSDPHHYETAEELAADLTSAYQHATETHQPYAERLEYYERAELLAYLGEPSDFDVDAIEQEATDTDEHGSRYWTADAEELAAIAQRNQR